MDISINALMLAIKAMQRDIDHHRMRLSDVGISDDDADYHGQYVVDLTQALGEIGDVYEHSRKETPAAPTLDQLLRAGAGQSRGADGIVAAETMPSALVHGRLGWAK